MGKDLSQFFDKVRAKVIYQKSCLAESQEDIKTQIICLKTTKTIELILNSINQVKGREGNGCPCQTHGLPCHSNTSSLT